MFIKQRGNLNLNWRWISNKLQFFMAVWFGCPCLVTYLWVLRQSFFPLKVIFFPTVWVFDITYIQYQIVQVQWILFYSPWCFFRDLQTVLEKQHINYFTVVLPYILIFKLFPNYGTFFLSHMLKMWFNGRLTFWWLAYSWQQR